MQARHHAYPMGHPQKELELLWIWSLEQNKTKFRSKCNIKVGIFILLFVNTCNLTKSEFQRGESYGDPGIRIKLPKREKKKVKTFKQLQIPPQQYLLQKTEEYHCYPEVWYMSQQHWHYRGAYQKRRISVAIPQLLNQNLRLTRFSGVFQAASLNFACNFLWSSSFFFFFFLRKPVYVISLRLEIFVCTLEPLEGCFLKTCMDHTLRELDRIGLGGWPEVSSFSEAPNVITIYS